MSNNSEKLTELHTAQQKIDAVNNILQVDDVCNFQRILKEMFFMSITNANCDDEKLIIDLVTLFTTVDQLFNDLKSFSKCQS